MNRSLKSGIVAALLLITNSNFADTSLTAAYKQPKKAQQSPEQTCAPTPEPCPAPTPEPCTCCPVHNRLDVPCVEAYNAPSRIDISCGWNTWVDASFLYWQPTMDNMEPAIEFSEAIVINSIPIIHESFKYFPLDSDFKPGFRVGGGISLDHDHWDVGAEYTWFHTTEHFHKQGEQLLALYPAALVELFALAAQTGNGSGTGANFAVDIKADWRLQLDVADLNVGRWYHVGTRLAFHPFFGAKATWIHQQRKETSIHASGNTIIFASAKTDSWAVGAAVGVNTNWTIGCGFRFFGDVSGDLSFTRYSLNNHSIARRSGADVITLHSQEDHLNAVRPHVDVDLGFGWETYFACDAWHLDVSIGWEFQTFFDQNMFRRTYTPPIFNEGGSTASSQTVIELPNSHVGLGNLSLQGLTVKARLDF